jgi:hypothetical protein
MKHLLSSLVMSLFLLATAWAESPVDIPNARLKSAIEGELWIPDPTPSDMLALTSLTIRGASISDLTGLEYAINLQSLDLRENRINDLSPLAGLTALTSLDLSMNQVSSVSPLAGLTNLVTLDVHDNHSVRDISSLSGLTKLQSLTLRHNTITDISALSGMSELRSLDLFENQITDVSPLAGLHCLTFIDLRSNPLGTDACETYIPQILENNPGVQFNYNRCGPLRIIVSSTAGGHVISPGEGEFEYPNGEVIYLQAVADPCFVFVGWSGSTTGTDNPMMYMVQGDQLIRANFVSLLNELYVDDNAPGDPKPGDAKTGDPQESGTQAHPFDSIQEAIDVAQNGAVVVVRPGTYRENLDLLGKKIHLQAINPANPLSGPCAVVEGLGAGPVVRITWSSGKDCGLTGFILTKGRGQAVAGISCIGASPTVSNCLIVGNRCSDIDGAALYFCDSEAVLINCTVADNYAGMEGAGLVLEGGKVTVFNSIFWGNSPSEISSRGEGDPLIRYCDVRRWWPDLGNLAVDPLFVRRGQWTDPIDSRTALGPEEARAVWSSSGDYHLTSQAGRWNSSTSTWQMDGTTSSCIDAGDPAATVGAEPSPNGGIINMGAYGGTTEASKSL